MAPDSPERLARRPGDMPAAELTPTPMAPRRGRWYGLTGFMSEGARPNSSLFGEILDWLWVPVMLLMPVSLLLRAIWWRFLMMMLCRNPHGFRGLPGRL